MPGELIGRAWILYTKYEGRVPFDYLYDDSTGNCYSYDSNVPNHKQVSVGDVVVIRTDRDVAGWGIIEDIEVTPHTLKLIRRCPSCRASNPRPLGRTNGFSRCDQCHLQFSDDEIIVDQVEVTAFRAYYRDSWVEAAPAIHSDELKSIEDKPGSQLAIRSVNVARLPAFLERLSARPISLEDEIGVARSITIAGGHVNAIARRRRGQRAFRFAMLRRYGEVCAFSGNQPPQVLEAAHLYSYARVAEHRSDGGILLRRDYHSLFDAKLLAVNPSSLTIEVAPQIQHFQSYGKLQDVGLRIDPKNKPSIDLLADHYEQALRIFSPN